MESFKEYKLMYKYRNYGGAGGDKNFAPLIEGVCLKDNKWFLGCIKDKFIYDNKGLSSLDKLLIRHGINKIDLY